MPIQSCQADIAFWLNLDIMFQQNFRFSIMFYEKIKFFYETSFGGDVTSTIATLNCNKQFALFEWKQKVGF